VWQGSGYKKVAYALADRGLVTVDRRRHSWQAAITEGGLYYLKHGEYQPAGAAGPEAAGSRPPQPRAVSAPRAAELLVTAESLLADLAGHGGTLTVPDPPGAVRAGYWRAISRVVTEGLAPAGHVLRHTGRDHGDLVIRLVPQDDEPGRSEALAAVPVPATLDGCHDAVAALRDGAGLPAVSEGTWQRALLIAQAIAAECSRRGYTFSVPGGEGASFEVAVGEDRFGFTLSEELERREVPDEQKLAAARYSWQRIPSSVRQVPSGRLVLRLGSGYGSLTWADRKRWTLSEKLPQVLAEIAGRADAAVQERRRQDENRRRRRQAWEDALPRARQAYEEQLNRDRIHQQAARSAEALAIRAYRDRLDALAAQCGDAGRAGQIRAWAAWAGQEADRADPLTRPADLAWVVPAEVRPADLDPFMPPGLTARYPPG
jgi:hypothetical protein